MRKLRTRWREWRERRHDARCAVDRHRWRSITADRVMCMWCGRWWRR